MFKRFISFILESDTSRHAIFVGRAQPPHSGHLKAVDMTKSEGEKGGGGHTILLTHTHNKDNPLTPEQKLKHAKRAFPGANVQMTSSESPSLLHHLSKIHKTGVKHLTIVAGADRAGEYKKLADTYNGKEGKHGHYKFDSITVKSAGERDPDAEGVEGASGTAMKRAAASGDREAFHKMASPHMTPDQKDEMMKDVRAGLDKFKK